MSETPKPIGPVPVGAPPNAREHRRVEDVEHPFEVDYSNPKHQALAKKIGWKRLHEIQKEERDAFKEAREL